MNNNPGLGKCFLSTRAEEITSATFISITLPAHSTTDNTARYWEYSGVHLWRADRSRIAPTRLPALWERIWHSCPEASFRSWVRSLMRFLPIQSTLSALGYPSRRQRHFP